MSKTDDELFAELEEQREFAPTWKPEENETLTGVILRYRKAYSVYGNLVDICEIKTKEGARFAIWLNSTVLLGKFRETNPKVGEKIAIRYFGKHPEKRYKRYAVAVDREQVDGGSHTFENPADREPPESLNPPAGENDLGISDDDIPF